jgi:hypothetical protein
MRDTNESVAEEALYAASYLQDPSDPLCPVINAYMFMLKQFNSFVTIRLKILNLLVINRKSSNLIKDLIYDKNLKIRLCVYDIIGEKIKLKYLNSEYRWRLLRRLMDEDDAHLADRLLKCLLTKWFNVDLDKNFLRLIKNLNVQQFKTDKEQQVILNLLSYMYQTYDLETLGDLFVANFELKWVYSRPVESVKSQFLTVFLFSKIRFQSL